MRSPNRLLKAFQRAHAVSLLALLAVVVGLVTPASAEPASRQPSAKNVILLVVDGCGAEGYTLARWFTGHPLTLDSMLTGAVKTYIADAVVADSAPMATAFACGIRTSDNFIGVGPRAKTITPVPAPVSQLQYRPLANVLEGAKLLGKATGVVSTSRVTHATPAAFMAHVPERGWELDIMEQAAHQNVDVVLGGGMAYLLPEKDGGKRKDGEDLTEVLRQREYRLVKTGEELAQVTGGRVFGMFSASHMAAEIDRPRLAPTEPTLEQMTRKAIELLSKNPKGFFLIVEGSQVDWAGHANDPAHLLSDLVMFDRTVAAALEYARRDGNTLVVALSDHNTGGMSIGNYRTSGRYSEMSYEELVEPLRKMKASAPAMWKELGGDQSPANVKRVVEKWWGLKITDQDAADLIEYAGQNRGNPHNAFGKILCARYTVIGWTSHGHVGGDVPLFAYGPGRPEGLHDAPEIGMCLADALRIDLKALGGRLFVEPAAMLPDAKVAVAGADGPNPAVLIELGGKRAELPVHKNLMKIGETTHELEGVVVYAPNTKKVYVPLQAIHLLTGTSAPLPEVATR